MTERVDFLAGGNLMSFNLKEIKAPNFCFLFDFVKYFLINFQRIMVDILPKVFFSY